MIIRELVKFRGHVEKFHKGKWCPLQMNTHTQRHTQTHECVVFNVCVIFWLVSFELLFSTTAMVAFVVIAVSRYLMATIIHSGPAFEGMQPSRRGRHGSRLPLGRENPNACSYLSGSEGSGRETQFAFSSDRGLGKVPLIFWEGLPCSLHHLEKTLRDVQEGRPPVFLSSVVLKWTTVPVWHAAVPADVIPWWQPTLSCAYSPADSNLLVLNYLFQMLYLMSLRFSSPPFPFAVWTESYAEGRASLPLRVILLPWIAKCKDCRHEAPCLIPNISWSLIASEDDGSALLSRHLFVVTATSLVLRALCFLHCETCGIASCSLVPSHCTDWF